MALTLGEHVQVLPEKRRGMVRYIGPLSNDGSQWVGVELEDAVEKGTDGNYKGIQYFHCQDGYGIFTLRENVTKLSHSKSTSITNLPSSSSSSHPHSYGQAYSSSPTTDASPHTPATNEIGKVLERRMSLRPSPTQIESRGVVPPQYFNDPKRAYDSVEMGREAATWNLGTFLQRRPSQVDLERLGVVPPRYFENPKQNSQRLTLLREVVGHHMEDFLPRRKSIHDLASANILPEEYLENDVEEARVLQRQKTVDKKQELQRKLDKGRRPSVAQISEMGYISGDYVDILSDSLEKHSRKESRLQHIKDELDLPNNIAENLINFMHGGDTDPKQQTMMAQANDKNNTTAENSTNHNHYEAEDTLVKTSVEVPDEEDNAFENEFERDPEHFNTTAHGRQFSVDPYQGFVPMAPVKRKETQIQLNRRLSNVLRPSYQELESKKIVLDQSEEQQNGQENQKPNEESSYIAGMDEKSLYQLYGLADEVRQTHSHMDSAVQDLKSHLNLPDEVSHAVSVELLEELNRLDPTLSAAKDEPSSVTEIKVTPNGNAKPNNNNNNTTNSNPNKNQNVNNNTNDNKKSNNKANENKNSAADADIERYQTLIAQLQQAIAIEKEKVRESDRAYTLLQAQYQTNENELSTARAKEKEYVSRIQKLEYSPDERYKEIAKERDTLKTTVEELKARMNRQEQYYSRLENANNNQNTNTNNNNNNKDNKNEEYLNKISEIQKQHMILSQERDDYREKNEQAQRDIIQMNQALKRAEESKIQFIQQTSEQMNQLRYYLKRYNGAPAKQGDL